MRPQDAYYIYKCLANYCFLIGCNEKYKKVSISNFDYLRETDTCLYSMNSKADLNSLLWLIFSLG
ncbi:hypothetical protein PspMM1_36840 [Pseudoalteromonas sp. MM1]|nr:hypothetical protein PspMM1_36840 [Pseudoalteromonas sp. MM1]